MKTLSMHHILFNNNSDREKEGEIKHKTGKNNKEVLKMRCGTSNDHIPR